MKRNVGPRERYVRIAAGLATAVVGMRLSGWPRTALSALGLTEVVTGLARFCPVNQALGIGRQATDTLDENTEIRRESQVRSALGLEPSGATNEPPVTLQSDVFDQFGSATT